MRNETHPNLGYKFKAKEMVLYLILMCGRLDWEMIKYTVDEYINESFSYLLSVSGHMNYTFAAQYVI